MGAAMGAPIRVILFNADEGAAVELRQALLSAPDVRLVAELDDPGLLTQAVGQFPCDALVAHLDPAAKVVLDVIAQIAAGPSRVPVIAISGTTDGDVLLRAMKVGLRGFLVWTKRAAPDAARPPLNVDELRELLTQVSSERSVTKERGKLVSVVGSSGGVGATFLATNLAVELASLVESERKVALLDLDFRFGQVATLLDLEPQFTVADLCATPDQIDPQMIEKAFVKHESGVHVLARPHTFQQAEGVTAAHCANVISVLQDMFAYVVVDGPMRSDPGGRMILDLADFNLMVLQLLVTSVRNTDRMLQELIGQGFSANRLQFVCNRVGRESGHLSPEQVESTLGHKLFHRLPDDWKTVSATINVGRPLAAEDGRTKIGQAIRELATKIHGAHTAPQPAKSGSMLGRLFGGGKREAAASAQGLSTAGAAG